jgi:hypothetical protein
VSVQLTCTFANLINLLGGGYWKTRLKARGGKSLFAPSRPPLDGLIFARRIFLSLHQQTFSNTWTWINGKSFSASEKKQFPSLSVLQLN